MYDNGGPAYPTGSPKRDEDGMPDPDFYHGMTLLDHFAGEVLVGLLTTYHPGSYVEETEIAKVCYKVAGAMIKERDAHEKEG